MSYDVQPDHGPLPNFDHLAIVTAPHPALDTPAQHVEVIDASVRLLAVRMTALMHRGVPDGHGGFTRGIGLAANQVNVLKRVIVVDIPGKKAVRGLTPWVVTRGPLVIVNPVVDPLNGSLVVENEGSLSHPGLRLNIARPPVVRVSGVGLMAPGGNAIDFDAAGMVARCIQHLVDQLDGVTIQERARREAATLAAASEGAFA